MAENKDLQPQNDFVLSCVDKMQNISENLPAKVKDMMIDALQIKIEMQLDYEFANSLMGIGSDLLPKGYAGNIPNMMLAFKTGRSLGLDRNQSLQHTFTVNGRTRVYGDMMLALAMKHRLYKDIKFEYGKDVETDKLHGELPSYVKCTVIIEGREDVISIYKIEDAKKNPSYSNEKTPWCKGYARRMMKFRAQSFSLRDAFPDTLTGVYDEYEFEEIQTANKDITSETTDLGKKNGTDGLKDSLKGDEATEPTEVEIQDEDGTILHKESKKPENIDQIKDDFKRWKKEKIISKEEYKAFTDTGSSGEWDKVIKMHEEFFKKAGDKPLGKFAKKLSKIVDEAEYSDAINSIIGDDSIPIINPGDAGKLLRTKDEKVAKEIFELIESRKDMIDSSKKENSK